MNLRVIVNTIKSRYTAGAGFVSGIFNFFCGRSTFFAIVFTIVGIIQEFRGKLSGNFVLMISAIYGLVVAHSTKQDWNERQKAIADQIANISAIPPPRS